MAQLVIDIIFSETIFSFSIRSLNAPKIALNSFDEFSSPFNLNPIKCLPVWLLQECFSFLSRLMKTSVKDCRFKKKKVYLREDSSSVKRLDN